MPGKDPVTMNLQRGIIPKKVYVELRYLFCAHHLIKLHICTKLSQSIPKGFRVTDPDNRVDTRLAANVVGRNV